MGRRSRDKPQLTAEQKREIRRKKRQLRKQLAMEGSTSVMPSTRGPEQERNAVEEEQFWLGIRGKLRAERILNSWGIRPYWLSIRQRGEIPPLSGFFPCMMFTRQGRFYFGFLFREHRDRTFLRWQSLGARKELTGKGQNPLL